MQRSWHDVQWPKAGSGALCEMTKHNFQQMTAALILYIDFHYSQETSYFGKRIAAFNTVSLPFLLQSLTVEKVN